MNRKITGRLGAVALILTLISMSFAGGTLAKYTADVTGTATAADSAEWKADLNISQAAVGAGASDEVFYLHWRWKFSEDSGDNYTDTNLGTKTTLDTVKLDITCTVSQVAPTTAAP